MAMLCIGGVCIPYSMIWPLIVLALREVYVYFFGKPKAGPGDALPQEAAAGGVGGGVGGGGDEKAVSVRDAYEEPIAISSEAHWQEAVVCSQWGRPVFARFTATWCRPCRAVQPLFQKLCADHSGEADFVSVDVDDLDEIATAHQAVPIPTIICFFGGVAYDRMAGSDGDKIRRFVQRCLEELRPQTLTQ
eukprot:gene5712-6296_t